MMACKQYEGSSEWLDDISRLDQNEEEEEEMFSSEAKSLPDEYFYGFHGLNDPFYQEIGIIDYLYRILREDELVENKIFCQDIDSNRTVEQHVGWGSTYKSKFISTTLSLEVARNWAYFEMSTLERKARKVPLRIVQIDIQVLAGTKYEKKCINLCNEEVRNHFIKGAKFRNFAKSSSEVLFVEEIPKYVTTADNTSTHYYAQNLLHPPMTTPNYATNLTNMYELPKTLVFWEIDAPRPNTPPPKKEKKRKKERQRLDC